MMEKYKLVSKKGEGTFSEVIKAQNVKNGCFYAIKCMKSRFDSLNEVNSLREIQALRRLSPHPNIITLEEILFDQPTGRLALVFELMDMNLYEVIQGRQQRLDLQLVKNFMFQLFTSLNHMHSKGIFHRDIKPENILVEKNGDRLKLADLGSCRGIYSRPPFTEYISTRWYRAPECLLTDGSYGPEMDIWGAGCVFFEIMTLYPLFPGNDEIDQINRIHNILGTPSKRVLDKLKRKASSSLKFNFPLQNGTGIASLIPFVKKECIDFLDEAVAYDASQRITAENAVNHPCFDGVTRKQIETSTANSNSSKTQKNVLPQIFGRKPLHKGDSFRSTKLPLISEMRTDPSKKQSHRNLKRSKAYGKGTSEHLRENTLPSIDKHKSRIRGRIRAENTDKVAENSINGEKNGDETKNTNTFNHQDTVPIQEARPT
eukprot:CAMPEP_0116018740 /NCGR_PEP_ID=MMETSP0321-20121206/8825_1 /TAXON_ID=163516 /ORGANISM="Leptocylindrus danicus var. danicus, Strain B650" /LENGTH=429 /DNA_ID=CAMNT_0003489185 /DNA_START=979 /DNA_END=2269 /DNA_ORIENTATION=+